MASCHKFHDAGTADAAPDLTGYGSRDWLMAFIANPAADRFYGKNNDRMPDFCPASSPARRKTSFRPRRSAWSPTGCATIGTAAPPSAKRRGNSRLGQRGKLDRFGSPHILANGLVTV